VFLYDLTTESPLAAPLLFGGGVFRAFFASTGEQIIAPSGDGTARIWELTPEVRPVDEVKETAELLSGWSLNENKRLEPVAAPELRRRFELGQSHPISTTANGSWPGKTGSTVLLLVRMIRAKTRDVGAGGPYGNRSLHSPPASPA
jgi:hypothetical protein